MLQSLFVKIFRWCKPPKPEEFSGLEAVAYQRGYESYEVNPKNPYPKGTRLHECWQKGYDTCEEQMRNIW